MIHWPNQKMKCPSPKRGITVSPYCALQLGSRKSLQIANSPITNHWSLGINGVRGKAYFVCHQKNSHNEDRGADNEASSNSAPEAEGGCYGGGGGGLVANAMGTSCGEVQLRIKSHALSPLPPSLVLGSLFNGAIPGTGKHGWVMHWGRVAALGAQWHHPTPGRILRAGKSSVLPHTDKQICT